MTNLLRQSLTVAFLGAVLFALNLFAFTEPTQSPPGGNVSAPINTGGTTQDKTGWFTFQGGGTRSSTYLATQGGNVGIGTTDPQYKLDVQGDARWTGTLQGGSVPWGRLSSIPSYASRWGSIDEVLGQGNSTGRDITVGSATINGTLRAPNQGIPVYSCPAGHSSPPDDCAGRLVTTPTCTTLVAFHGHRDQITVSCTYVGRLISP